MSRQRSNLMHLLGVTLEFWERKMQSSHLMTRPMDRRLYTVREAANYLSLSPITLYHWIARREIPFVRLRRKAVRFDRQDLDKLVDALKSKTTKEARSDGALQARKE